MIDAVLSVHLNPATCGVSKFNQCLATALGVPLKGLDEPARHPLVSIKCSESPDTWWGYSPAGVCFHLFLHDIPGQSAMALLQRATGVFTANAEIADAVKGIRPDVCEAYCPSTIQGNPTRAAVTILTFGMAHKLQLQHYLTLKELLDRTGQDYTVCLSTAVHEGSPWDLVATAGDQLRDLFGPRVRVLGFLADDALAKELQDCSAVALFFDPALRANNTTFWAAVEAKKRIVTNLDRWSPIPHGLSLVEDINAMTTWSDFPSVQYGGGTPDYTWDSLVRILRR